MELPNKGFNIIEIIMTIAIVALLSWIIFTKTDNTRAKSRDIERVNNIKYIESVLQKYFNDKKNYPATLDPELLTPTYAKEIPKDPSTKNNYLYSVNFTGKTKRCLSYHIGATLEDTSLDSDLFKNDADLGAQPDSCPGSNPDFDGTDPLYDISN